MLACIDLVRDAVTLRKRGPGVQIKGFMHGCATTTFGYFLHEKVFAGVSATVLSAKTAGCKAYLHGERALAFSLPSGLIQNRHARFGSEIRHCMEDEF
jgi:hypothetical protein